MLLALGGGCARAPHVVEEAAPGQTLVLPEHYAHSIAALGFPGMRRSFQVGHGSAVGTGEVALEWRLVSPDVPVRTSPVYFEADGVPVAHWWAVGAHDSVHFEAAAVPNRALGDTSLLLSVRATATRLSGGPGTVLIEVRVRSLPAGPSFVPWDAPRVTRFQEAWQRRLALRDGRVVAMLDPATVLPAVAPTQRSPARFEGTGPGTLNAHCEARLAPGEQQYWDFWIPAYPIAPASAERLASEADHARAVTVARLLWREWLQRASPLETPDSLVNAAWRASLVTLILCQERDGEGWVPVGSPFQYRDVWLRDGARTVRALAVAGLTDLARADARSFAAFQLPVGAFLSQRGQLDGTGEALWALDQACARPPDAGYARGVLPAAAGGLRWIERQREATRSLAPPWPGLLPYGDPRDNERVRAQLVGNDAWSLAGERAVAALAHRAGDTTLAAEAERALNGYRAAFGAALARSGSRDVPPSWQGAGRDWGNLSAGYPTRALAPDDPRLEALARRVWARAGGTGLVCYGPADSLHSYLGADLAQSELLAGRPAAARAYLADLIAHASSTLGHAEIAARDGGFGANLPPHTTSSATLVDLVRNLLVGDEADTLELAPGAPLAWWRGTRFERAATRFGAVTLRLDQPAPDRLRARWSAVSVPTRVRVPDGARVLAALSPGARVVAERWIECAPGASELVFRIRQAEEPAR